MDPKEVEIEQSRKAELAQQQCRATTTNSLSNETARPRLVYPV
jgi:hypothetical protein